MKNYSLFLRPAVSKYRDEKTFCAPSLHILIKLKLQFLHFLWNTKIKFAALSSFLYKWNYNTDKNKHVRKFLYKSILNSG